MTPCLTDDERMIRDAAESVLAELSDSAAVRRAMATDTGYDAALWRRIGDELGWCGIAIDEAHRGLGLAPLALALVQEQIGRRLLCAPFFASACVAAPWIAQAAAADARARLLPGIASGAARWAVSLRAGACRAPTLQARAAGAHWRLDGDAGPLLDGASADHLLLHARTDAGAPALFMVARDAAGVAVTPLQTWDATRRFAQVRLRGVETAERIDDPARAAQGAPAALALARLYLAAEQLGAAQQCLDLTVAYTATRRQFGRAVAGFQAVKHRCAEMMVRIESLRSAVYGAARAAHGEAGAAAAEIAATTALAKETLFFCAQEAIQLHGGVGFTWEYDPQLYFKRAQASQHWLGSIGELLEEAAGSWLDQPPATAVGAAAAADDADDADAALRAEVAAWMRSHLRGRFAALKHRGGPGDEAFEPALRKDWERELAAGGWTCVGWPRAHGGRGLSIAQQVIFHEEYARAGGPGRMGHIGEGLIGPTLIRFGTPAQQARFLPDIVAGRCYWAQGYSEPGAGSDLANVQTRCWQEPDGSWRVEGQKIWTSLAQDSDWIFVLARCEPGSRGHRGLAFLLLPLHQPGVEIRPIRQMNGGAEFNEVFFDQARAAADDIVGAPGAGWQVAMGLLEAERGVSTLGQQMRFAHELELVIAAASRGGGIEVPGLRERLVRAVAGLRVMRHNALRMLADAEATGLRREALIYKYYWSNWHRDLGRLAMDLLGEAGDVVCDDPLVRPLQQLFFFSRADTLYAGTNEIQLNLIAERGLGMPKEPRPA